MQELFGNLWNLQWQQVVMWGIGGPQKTGPA